MSEKVMHTKVVAYFKKNGSEDLLKQTFNKVSAGANEKSLEDVLEALAMLLPADMQTVGIHRIQESEITKDTTK
ncbi:MAG: hypothetical protein LBM95_08785 [Lactobacillales bacterium]|jgi:hypothetical protein|nr:hypothetical protein [Lactobacillales bacterium]